MVSIELLDHDSGVVVNTCFGGIEPHSATRRDDLLPDESCFAYSAGLMLRALLTVNFSIFTEKLAMVLTGDLNILIYGLKSRQNSIKKL